MHAVSPTTSENFPGLHARHDMSGDPMPVLMVPASHRLQVVWPSYSWNLPGMHDLHVERPVLPWYIPLGQDRHTEPPLSDE